MNFFAKVLVGLLLLAYSSGAIAGGTGARGGGSILKLDHSYSLSEVFLLKGVPGERLQITADLAALLLELRSLITVYTGASLNRYWDEVVGPYSDYRLTATLPCEGVTDAAPRVLGEEAQYVGCTVNGVTYLDPKLFSGLDTKQKILTLLHERAHVFDSSEGAHAEWIYPFIQGLYVLFTVRLEQEKGIWRDLEPYELRALRGLLENREIYERLEDAREFAPSGFEFLSPQGGGKIEFDREEDMKSFRMDAASYVGVDSLVDYSRIRCALRNRQSYRPTIAGSHVASSVVRCANLSATNVEASRIDFQDYDRKGFAELSEMTISSSNLEIAGRDIVLQSSRIAGSSLVNDSVDLRFRLSDSVLEKSRIDFTHFMKGYSYTLGFFAVGKPGVWISKETVLAGLDAKTRQKAGNPLADDRASDMFEGSKLTTSLSAPMGRRPVFNAP